MTLGSLFDGIGGFPFAATLSGIEPIWAAEIEPACVAITKQHFPEMQHLGSVTDINGAEIPPVDIITFGSPCQDLSVAGNRAGLDGERSGLFSEAIRIIYEMRAKTNVRYPTYIVWENVPGAFSSHKGSDFRTVLEQLTKTDIPMPASGRWASAGVVRGSEICAAWRVLDAQYWGVPQRRKRIYLIGSFGNRSAEEILFKRESLRGYLAEGRTEGQEVTADFGGSVDVGCEVYDDEGGQSITVEKEEISPTLRNQAHGNEPVVCYRTRPGYCNGTIYALDRASFNQGLNAQYDIDINDSGINSTLVAKGPGAVAYKHIKWIIRRLIPLECERLQGYPDNWTVIPKITEMTDEQYQFFADVFLLDKQIKGLSAKQPSKDSLIKWYNKLACDGNRYKALGNSLAIPCALRVIAGIAEWKAHQCV